MAIRYLDEGGASSEPIAVGAPTAPSRIRYLEDPAEKPLSPQQAFEQQFIAEGTQTPLGQAMSALVAGPKAGLTLAKGLGELALKGIQGGASIYGKAAGQQTLADMLKSGYGDMIQTWGEAGPRAVYDVGQGLVAGFQSPETATQTLRSLSGVTNPLAAAMQALANPQATPTQARAQQAFEENALNQALAKQGEQGIAEFFQKQGGLVPAGTANIDAARGGPLLLGAEALPGAVMTTATKTLPELIKQVLRSGATWGATPMGSLPRAAKAVDPFLSGTRLAEAQTGVEGALARQSALDRALQEAAIKEQAATRQAAQGITEVEGTTAGKGLEAITAQRELQTAQGTITPEIIQAQASIQEAAQMPVVILGRTAADAPTFGSRTISAVEGPMKASQKAFEDAYTAVTNSLPTNQTKVAAQPLFDAAKQAQGELSQGFEAYNKGTIKRILDESTRVTQVESTVPQSLRDLYNTEGINPSAKAALLKQYPDLAGEATAGAIPQYTWSELQERFRELNQGINQAIKYGDTNDARILGDLKDGLVTSMDNYASKVGGDTLNLFKKANAQYGAHQDKFGLNRIQTLFKDDVIQNPAYVAKNLLIYENPSQVNALKAIVSPEEFVPVQAQFSQKLFSPNADVPFDPSHFVKQFASREARDTAKAVFGEQGLADLNRINDAAKSFAKIQDLQKTLDNLATQSESATQAFSKAKGTMTEAKRVLAEKNAVKAQLKAAVDDPEIASKIASSNADLKAALKELDRVKNYRDFKDWGTRFSGLNILEAATTSPAWEQLARYSALHLDKYQDPNNPSP